MAALTPVIQSLASLLNSGLPPKDLTERYRITLRKVVQLKNGELIEGLKSFIDAGLGHLYLY